MPIKYKVKKDRYNKFNKQISETTVPIIEKFFDRKNIVLDYIDTEITYNGIMEIRLHFRENILPEIKLY